MSPQDVLWDKIFPAQALFSFLSIHSHCIDFAYDHDHYFIFCLFYKAFTSILQKIYVTVIWYLNIGVNWLYYASIMISNDLLIRLKMPFFISFVCLCYLAKSAMWWIWYVYNMMGQKISCHHRCCAFKNASFIVLSKLTYFVISIKVDCFIQSYWYFLGTFAGQIFK